MAAGSTVSSARPTGAHTNRCHRQESCEDEGRCANRVLHDESFPLPYRVLLSFCDFHSLRRAGPKLGYISVRRRKSEPPWPVGGWSARTKQLWKSDLLEIATE